MGKEGCMKVEVHQTGTGSPCSSLVQKALHCSEEQWGTCYKKEEEALFPLLSQMRAIEKIGQQGAAVCEPSEWMMKKKMELYMDYSAEVMG